MADINDPDGLRKRLDRQINLLHEAANSEGGEDEVEPIHSDDEEAILKFLNHLQANRSNKSQTNANYVKNLRLTAQRGKLPLVKMGESDLEDFTVRMKHQEEKSKETINNYKKNWKPFFRYLGRSWASEIEFYNLNSKNKVERWRVYSEEEISDMLEKADGRNTAVIAVMADTGSRIGAVCSAFLGAVDLSGTVAIISLNDNAPLKGADGNVPLTWSRSYLVNYLQGSHPRPNRDDVGLIHKKRGFDESDSGALSPTTLRSQIYDVMEDVGISKKRREMHNFRHTAVTKWLRMGISKEVIQYRTKWTDMSMLENYAHLHEEDKIQMTAEEFGLIQPEETDAASRPEDAVGDCPVCGATVRSGGRYCPGCGNPITADAAHNEPPSEIQSPSDTGDELIQFDSVQEEMTTASVLEQLLNQNPELLDEIDLERDD
jgi:integrase/recombinase XerD